MPTPPLPPDRHAVTAFWETARLGLGLDGPEPPADCFGDSVALADELVTLVVDGPKRATAGALAHYEHDGAPVPVVGARWIATDGRGAPRALLRTVDVRIGPLSSVDDAFAWDEGEGDRTRATWLADHTAYFERTLPPIGVAFHPDIDVVFERFTVEYRA